VLIERCDDCRQHFIAAISFIDSRTPKVSSTDTIESCAAASSSDGTFAGFTSSGRSVSSMPNDTAIMARTCSVNSAWVGILAHSGSVVARSVAPADQVAVRGRLRFV